MPPKKRQAAQPEPAGDDDRLVPDPPLARKRTRVNYTEPAYDDGTDEEEDEAPPKKAGRGAGSSSSSSSSAKPAATASKAKPAAGASKPRASAKAASSGGTVRPSGECSLCMEGVAEYSLIPCGHCILCKKCANYKAFLQLRGKRNAVPFDLCPMCRTKMEPPYFLRAACLDGPNKWFESDMYFETLTNPTKKGRRASVAGGKRGK